MRKIIKKWHGLETVRDLSRPNVHKCLISRHGMLAVNSTIEVRLASFKNWNKRSNKVLRAQPGKIGKAKQSNVKIHSQYFSQRAYAFSGISRENM